MNTDRKRVGFSKELSSVKEDNAGNSPFKQPTWDCRLLLPSHLCLRYIQLQEHLFQRVKRDAIRQDGQPALALATGLPSLVQAPAARRVRASMKTMRVMMATVKI